MVHLDSGSDTGPLCGAKMHDSNTLISDKGMGMVVEDCLIKSITDSETIHEEWCPGLHLENKQKLSVSKYGENTIIDLAGCAVIPGLIDAHTHLLWSGDRSREIRWKQQGFTYKEIAKKGGGIAHTVNSTRNSTDKELLQLGFERLKKALKFGTTCMEVKSGYGLSTEQELRLLSLSNKLADIDDLPGLDITWLGAHSTPPVSNNKSDISRTEYVEKLISEQLPEVKQQKIARSADVFCEPGWFNIDETERICRESISEGLEIRLHVDEFQDSGGADLAAELKATTADHALFSNDDGRINCAKSGTIQGFLPGTPYVMGLDKWPPFDNCIEEEWPWTIATDFNPNCQILSLPFIGSITTQNQNIDPLASLVACTRNAAKSVVHNQGFKQGILSEGFVANLNIVKSENWENWCQTPGTSPFANTMLKGKLVH